MRTTRTRHRQPPFARTRLRLPLVGQQVSAELGAATASLAGTEAPARLFLSFASKQCTPSTPTKQTSAPALAMSSLGQKRTLGQRTAQVRFCPQSGHQRTVGDKPAFANRSIGNYNAGSLCRAASEARLITKH